MSEATSAQKERPFIVTLFNFTGRISPGRYWLAIASAIAVLGLMLFTLTVAMDPRGSADPAIFMAALLVMFAWIILAAMTQRLRDAGKPPALSVVFLIGMFASLFLSLVLMESAPILGVIGAVAILVIVGHIDTIFKMRHHSE